MTLSYKEAGVDVAAADSFVRRIGALAAATAGANVVTHESRYAGLIRPELSGMKAPLIAATCDGVGTKLLVAEAAKSFDGLGQDLVAMSVNDLLPLGARPLLFLDYIAVGKLEPTSMEAIVASVARACKESGCALLGGETAEMPGVYRDGHFDLAGFAVGLVDEARLPRPEEMQEGDVVLALPSSGIHSNGLSLARAALLDKAGLALASLPPKLRGKSLAEELLTPTALYVAPVLRLLVQHSFRAAAHITGGGLLGRCKRLARPNLRVVIDPASYEIPPIFELIAEAGGISRAELAATFNLGLGFVAVLAPEKARAVLKDHASDGWREVGHIARGKAGVELGYASADSEG